GNPDRAARAFEAPFDFGPRSLLELRERVLGDVALGGSAKRVGSPSGDLAGQGRADLLPGDPGPGRQRLLAGARLPALLDPGEELSGQIGVEAVELRQRVRGRAPHRPPPPLPDPPAPPP